MGFPTCTRLPLRRFRWEWEVVDEPEQATTMKKKVNRHGTDLGIAFHHHTLCHSPVFFNGCDCLIPIFTRLGRCTRVGCTQNLQANYGACERLIVSQNSTLSMLELPLSTLPGRRSANAINCFLAALIAVELSSCSMLACS